MKGLKLLALRPTHNCDLSIIKGLKIGLIYQFHFDEYVLSLTNKHDIHSEVQLKRSRNKTTRIYDTKKMSVNISAIVGKNGSGKSSLIDLFYATCFAISVIDNKIVDLIGKSKKNQSKKSNQSLNQPNSYETINCELYYEVENKIYRIRLSNGNYQHETYFENSWKRTNFNYENFFYTVAVNYSLYGLNEVYSPWYKYLFHKNDGYQIPIVINPYRDNGNIDVNSELHLSQTRTLLNLSVNGSKNPIIVNNKRVAGVAFVMDIIDNDSIKLNNNKINCVKVFFNHRAVHGESIFQLFNRVSEKLCNFVLSDEEIRDLEKSYTGDLDSESSKKFLFVSSTGIPIVQPTEIIIKYQFIKYVINKLFKICISYPNDYGAFMTIVGGIPELVNTDSFIEKISMDKSHLTIKIRQALYSIKENYFTKTSKWTVVEYHGNRDQYNYQLFLGWETVKSLINNAQKNNNKFLEERMEVVPGAFVKPKLQIVESRSSNHNFNELSSGEQQLANTIQTIVYHLYNINSVHKSPVSKRKYRYVNLIFDEIELYFHPEFQRSFIFSLLEAIKRVNLRKIDGINILFSTHSPFIISDIPTEHILRLDNGIPKHLKNRIQTFGSNISDLLADGFYLDSSIGKFADSTILAVIRRIELGIDNEDDSKIIKLIGDSFLKSSIEYFKQKKHDKN